MPIYSLNPKNGNGVNLRRQGNQFLLSSTWADPHLFPNTNPTQWLGLGDYSSVAPDLEHHLCNIWKANHIHLQVKNANWCPALKTKYRSNKFKLAES